MKNKQFEDILIYFSKSLLGKENEDEILWDLAKNCISKLGFVDCVIYLIDHDNNLLIQKAAYGPKNPKDQTLYKPVEISIGEGITGHVAKTGVAEIVNDTSMDLRYIKDDELRLSEICVPITFENTIYGVIDCEHPQVDFFNPHHLKMLSAIASICAIKIKSVRATRALLDEQDRLYKIKEEMLELKLKALNSQMNPHFVFNALNAIQYFVASEEKRMAMDYLSTFSKLIRFYLKRIEHDTAVLSEEIEMLHGYLKLQKLRYDGWFEYSINTESSPKLMNDAIIPSFIIQTLFENIIEKAMSNTEKDHVFDVAFAVSESAVTINVHHQRPSTGSNIASEPEYREGILKWQDHVRLLNAVKNYHITNDVSITDNNELYESRISIKLPNLNL
ncbi:histidine kinase [Allomuricauda sp. CAU 1633]|uniref:histidine kinase n=1 Tax=Allomuricauda sp. CAU 1633 TaxID=2816036 RepID=UPI001F5CDF8B|nr:histidine kinase [Muricauda sp. CAU 1633]